MNSSQLLRAPKPFDFEAVSCWLPRLALSQGAELREVAQFCGIDLGTDIDRSTHGEKIKELRRLCGLHPSAFAIPERLMQSLELMKPAGDRFMAREGRGKARFRFCVCCLLEMRVPHFPIHWRFIAWRRCPVHDCLLEDRCVHCKSPVLFPASIQASTAGRAGYSSLDRCLHCSRPLTSVHPCFLQDGAVRRVNGWEETQLANGRALLAALVNRSFRIEGRYANYRLTSLTGLERQRAFAVRMDWLSPEAMRRRATASAAVQASGSNVARTG